MNALAIVNKLLETEDNPDPKDYALSTNQPTELMRGALRDELVERGWRHIHVRPEDEGEWVIEAGFIDSNHRAYWENAGARVAPGPTDAPILKIMRNFKAAARRAGMVIDIAKLVDVSPAHEGFDLQQEFEDFEDDPGDWNVAIHFRWHPAGKFWSKASQALGYEQQPYQQPVKPSKFAAGKESEKIAQRLKRGAPEPLSPEEDLRRAQEWVKRTTGPENG